MASVLPKKVKVHLADASSIDARTQHFYLARLEVRQRVRICANAISLVISVGAFSLLLTRHGNCAMATELLGDKNQLRLDTATQRESAIPSENDQMNIAQVNLSNSGRQISPTLPPLGAAETYLPKPFDNSTPAEIYTWPAQGILTSGYGRRWGRMHRGIDIAAPTGTPIVASAMGVVVKAGWDAGGFGNLVEIRHPDGTLTRYAHNNRVLVKVGQPVQQGQLVAKMGSTGRSTGSHSHFEFHLSGKGAVNPIAYLPRQSS